MPLKDISVVLRHVGLVVPVVGFMACLSMPVAVIFGELHALWPLGITAMVSFVFGGLLFFTFRQAASPQLPQALVVASLAWLLVAGVGALPFALIADSHLVGHSLDAAGAFFESLSGFTTTGLTMFPEPELLPRTLQWWRSFTQWIGGMGIIVLMLTLLGGPGPASLPLYTSEGREKIRPSVPSSVRTMWKIYVLFTVAGAVLLRLAGMPLWEAINHGMTSLSTGGFSISSASMGQYASLPIELLSLVLMLLGATSFAVHYLVLSRGIKELWFDIQARTFLILTLIWIGALFAVNLANMPALASVRVSFYQAASASTTTGFQTVDLTSWTSAAKLVLVMAMVIGAGVGSTAGGLKVLRALLLLKGVSWQLRRTLLPPSAISFVRLGRRRLTETEAGKQIASAGALLFLWLFFLAAATLGLLRILPESTAVDDVVFEVVSAQSTVGLSSGISSPDLPTAAKLILCFSMWIGRLEIIPVIIFIRSLVRRTL